MPGRATRLSAWVFGAVLGLGLSQVHGFAQEPYYRGGSLDVRQHGYEHGYRDGYDYGLDARSRNVALDFHTDSYRDAIRGYNPAFGSRDAYRQGYREGYAAGAQDAYSGSRSGLERVYSWRDPNFDPDRVREDPSTRIYAERQWGYRDVSNDIGYRDGVNAGLKDFRERHSYRPEQHDAWKDADHGYAKAYGSKEEYKRVYRAAYEAGYRAGFGRR